MPTVLFLSDLRDAPISENLRENVHTLPRAFAEAGWRVLIEPHALTWNNGKIQAGKQILTETDLVWPLGLGDRSDFIDRMQLLAHSGARFINKPEVYLLLHGKLMWADLMPETHAANDWKVLADVLIAGSGDWILKPAAGSFGRDVVRLNSDDTSLLRSTMLRNQGSWFVLQRRIPAISAGEHRSVLVGNEIIGCYRRTPRDGLRANLTVGGHASAGYPGADEHHLVQEVASRLCRAGAGFAAIDTSGPHLIEVNVANPGGLGTLQEVYRQDYGAALVSAVTRWLQDSVEISPCA